MPPYLSRTSTHGRNMAGARGLWRATGMKDGDFGKPIIAIANSFTQFVPGHVHLKDMGQLVAGAVEKAGGVWSGVVAAGGTAGWFRLYANATDDGEADPDDEHPRIDGSVGTSGRDLNLTSVSLTAGATQTIDTFKITLPEAA